MIIDAPAKCETQKTATVGRIAPQIGTHERVGTQTPRGLFASFADHRFDERLTILEMPGGLVQDEAAAIRSSTMRNRPSRLTIAATVTSGFQRTPN
jgi:hypothetical protein